MAHLCVSKTERSDTVLSLRALNRALLARQMLLRRETRSALETVDYLVGMQAQEPKDPYIALWTRLDGFDPSELERLLLERQVARTPLLRGTLHLATAPDCLTLRPLLQPVLDRIVKGSFTKRLAGVEPAELAAAGRVLLADQPRTFAEVRQSLVERWPQADPQALGYCVSYLVPLVQVPPRGLWSKSGQTRWLTTEAWFGRPVEEKARPEDLVMRYLAAFGPATVGDIQAWCGLTRLREVVDRLRPELVTFRDERGKELFDLPDAPRPGSEVPAPPRFLPEYDNVLLGHADRSRIIAEQDLKRLTSGTGVGYGTVLLDGFVAATWKVFREGKDRTLEISPFAGWSKEGSNAVTEEAERLRDFVAADSTHREIRLAPPP